MNPVIRNVTLVGNLIIHQVDKGRFAIEVGGANLYQLLFSSIGIGLKDDVESWDIGPCQVSIGPMERMEQLVNPERAIEKVQDGYKVQAAMAGRNQARKDHGG